MRSCNLLALTASLSAVSAVYQGFNYGATKDDGYTVRVQSDFQSLFQTAKNLVGNSGFTSARLYTTIQGGTASDPTSAIPAAIAEGTSLLLGLWASAGQTVMTNEITALQTAITKYGPAFTDLVAGISVGSEDLYRISPIGIAAKSGYGADPAIVASYIGQVRTALAGTALSSAPIGHVDTWTAWVNGSNSAVVQASDFLGMDAYPYFQNTQANGIENGASLFNDALGVTQQAGGGKPVWITETGFPVSGSVSGSAQPSIADAKTYWDAVGCPNFGKVNTWWFTLVDTDNASPNPSFGITSGGTTPLFDLSCSDVQASSSMTGSSPATTITSSASSVSSASAASSATTAAESMSTLSSAASVTVSASAPAASLSSAASVISTGLVSSGGPLAPTQGNGIGFNGTAIATATGSAAFTATASSNITSVGGTGSSSGSTTAPLATVSANVASSLPLSALAGIAAVIAVAAFL